jgi:hypothetical protein
MPFPGISVKFSPSGSEPVHQTRILPGFYLKSEPALDPKRPLLRAFGLSFLGILMHEK